MYFEKSIWFLLYKRKFIKASIELKYLSHQTLANIFDNIVVKIDLPLSMKKLL